MMASTTSSTAVAGALFSAAASSKPRGSAACPRVSAGRRRGSCVVRCDAGVEVQAQATAKAASIAALEQFKISADRYMKERSSIAVIGLSIHIAPVEMREKLAVAEELWPRAVSELTNLNHIEEAAVLSTCNRMEIYVVALSWNRGIREVVDWMSKKSGILASELSSPRWTSSGSASSMSAASPRRRMGRRRSARGSPSGSCRTNRSSAQLTATRRGARAAAFKRSRLDLIPTSGRPRWTGRQAGLARSRGHWTGRPAGLAALVSSDGRRRAVLAMARRLVPCHNVPAVEACKIAKRSSAVVSYAAQVHLCSRTRDMKNFEAKEYRRHITWRPWKSLFLQHLRKYHRSSRRPRGRSRWVPFSAPTRRTMDSPLMASARIEAAAASSSIASAAKYSSTSNKILPCCI